MLGLDNVPAEVKDAARGHGLHATASCCGASSCRSRCRRSSPALRIAATTTVGLATLAFFAGAGGLGEPLFDGGEGINFQSNVVVAGGLCVLLAIALDLVLLGVQRAALPWQRARGMMVLASALSAVRRRPATSSSSRTRRSYGDTQVGGPHEVLRLLGQHLELSGFSLLFAALVAIPLGLRARPHRHAASSWRPACRTSGARCRAWR